MARTSPSISSVMAALETWERTVEYNHESKDNCLRDEGFCQRFFDFLFIFPSHLY